MKITMVGTGYVGLVTGTCFSEMGNEVTCVDVDAEKVAQLRNGDVPIYEPGLAELIGRNAKHGRLQFTTDLGAATRSADVVFIAVGTPSSKDGSADLSNVDAVTDAIGPHLSAEAIVVIKSTVPVGTNQRVFERLRAATGRDCRVASNPEFLKEGAAIDDFMKPDRVVVGAREEETVDVLRHLYAPYLRTEKPFLAMRPESAEMTKYVANALLATKISFINETAKLCELMGADVNDVRRGIGHDQRIGFAFLFPGVGYGGSCFPKDVRALVAMARDQGAETPMLKAVDGVNEAQKSVLFRKIENYLGDRLSKSRIAIWGLAFKPRTDDVREAPSRVLIDQLLRAGVDVTVHDPVATENIRRIYGDRLTYAEEAYDALDGADVLAINTEWEEYRRPDFRIMRERMNEPAAIFDGRNLYEPATTANAGFYYESIGRPRASDD